MAGNANTTISFPGSDWQILWGNGSFDNFQLDIVGFLAILGEGAVTANAQVSALSRLFYLPRLLPAPQALLWPARPIILSPAKATVTGVFSGNTKDHLHHVANILLRGEQEPFTVRCVEITKDTSRRSLSSLAKISTDIQRRATNLVAGKTEKKVTASPELLPPSVKANPNGPLSWVTLLGCFLSVALFIISITVGDGMSLLATILLSLLSTLAGIGNKWDLKLPQPSKDSNSKKPAADVVVRWPNGSFVVVKCDEEVARELFFAPEEIQYRLQSKTTYRMLSLLGTLMLMLGVIFLANAKLQLQFAWAGAYIILNAAHWVAAALPQRLHWDVSCYKLKEQYIEGRYPGPKSKTFTIALWKAICFTEGSTTWVRTNGAAPKTEVWEKWVRKAGEEGLKGAEAEDSYRIGSMDSVSPAEGFKTGKKCKPIWNESCLTDAVIRKMPDWNPRDAWSEYNDEVVKTQVEPVRILFPRKHDPASKGEWV